VVDGTDFRLPWISKKFWSYKFRTCGLRYEVATAIQSGDICWINGPFEPGMYNDDMIFRHNLRDLLEPNERVEADDGYRFDAPKYIKCPGSISNPQHKQKLQQRLRAKQETCNKRFKQWNILKNVYRHEITAHGNVFRAICVITQVAFENGEPLFEVDYDD
jgi:hypothetical protein